MNALIKRLIDVLASSAILVALFPVLLLIALAIRLESSGSPLFFQERVGRNGKIFRIVKFRSMVKNAPRMGTAWTQENDARITRVGRFIRRTSLDELPQLWNVLVGDMSLVGARPMLMNDSIYYAPEEWRLRHSVPVGITGLAQVNGRSSLNREQQMAYDLEYAGNWSIAMDFLIIWKTILIVIQRKGVN